MGNFSREEEDLDEFLAPYVEKNSLAYRDAPWLEVPFDSHSWRIRCDSTFTINWDVRLDDGELLTNNKHAALWETLRKLLIIQTHVDVTGGTVYAPRSLRNRLQRAIHCVDYFLLRSSQLQLAQFGLSSLTTNEIREMVATLGNGRSVVTSAYDWPAYLARHLRSLIDSTPYDLLERTLATYPFLGEDIPDVEDRLTDLENNEIVRARSCLWLQKSFTRGQGNGAGYSWVPSSRILTTAVYANTIFGAQIQVPVACELSLRPDRVFITEYPRARVYSPRDERMDAKLLGRYVSVIESLQLLEGAPLSALDKIGRATATANLDLKSAGRFRTLPYDVVFISLRKAIELLLQYGEPILDSFTSVLSAASSARCTVFQYCQANSLSPHLTEGAKKIGVKRWTIENARNVGRVEGSLSRHDYYVELRACTGLWETLRVVYGAGQVVVGTLLAQRSGSLIDLIAQDCLDISRSHLLFNNAKSGHSGLQERIARPIPPIAARCIDIFERMQATLIERGALAAPTNLFAAPATHGDAAFKVPTKSCYNESLDFFCDWIETPLDSEGKRFYIRQHQLRRFFAMLFFWGGGFGGMDTLRWFLGHTDVEHLWRYISEFTPGATLRSVAAQYAAYGVKHAAEEAEILGSLVLERFGTSNYSVIEDDVLQAYIESLIEEGRLSVEPQFLDGGTQYRIAVFLTPARAEAA